MEKKISVKDLLMQAFLTGWELSDKSISQDEYLQSAIQVIEVLQVEPENIYAEEGLGLTDGDEVDHLDDLLRADGQWLYYGVEAENFFLIQWYPDEASAKAKLAQLEELGDGKQYLVDLSLRRSNPTEAENFGNSNPVQLRSEASPFGRGVTAGDGEGKPMAIELQAQRYAAAFVRAIVPQRGRVAGSVLALSGASRQLSQGESLL